MHAHTCIDKSKKGPIGLNYRSLYHESYRDLHSWRTIAEHILSCLENNGEESWKSGINGELSLKLGHQKMTVYQPCYDSDEVLIRGGLGFPFACRFEALC